MNGEYAILSAVIVSILSVLAALPLLYKKKVTEKTLLFLLSLSVGVLLSTAFIGLLPEAISEKYTLGVALYVLFGFITMFLLEKFIHHHHNKKCAEGHCEESHKYSIAPINLLGDAVHNFIDGVVIAAAYSASVTIGIAATISIIFHEIPQEIADFGVLLYSGMTKKKALLYNFLSATIAILGTIIGILLIDKLEGFNKFIIPFAAGNFIYIAASNLTPQLHRHCKPKDSIIHISAIILGIGIIVLVTLYGPAHVHG